MKELAKEIVSRRLTSSEFVEKIGSTMQLLGTVGKLGPNVDQPIKLLSALGAMMGSTKEISKIFTEQSEQEAFLIQEALKEYTGIIKTFREILKIRESAANTLASTLARYEKNPEDTGLAQQLQKIQYRNNAITHVLMAEIQRFHTNRDHDFQYLLRNFVETQIQHSKRIIDAWQKTLNSLK